MKKLDDLPAPKSLELSAGAPASKLSAQNVARITPLLKKVDARRNNAATVNAISAGKGVLNPHGDLTKSLRYAKAANKYKTDLDKKPDMTIQQFRTLVAGKARQADDGLDVDIIFSTYLINGLRKKLYSTGKALLDKIETNPIALKHFGLLKDEKSRFTQAIKLDDASIVGTLGEKTKATQLLIRAKHLTTSLQQKKAAQEKVAQITAAAKRSDEIDGWVRANGKAAVSERWSLNKMREQARYTYGTSRDGDAYKKLNGLIMARLVKEKGKANISPARLQEIDAVDDLMKKNTMAQKLLPEAVQGLMTRRDFERRILRSIATATDKDKRDAKDAATILVWVRDSWKRVSHGV